MCSGNVVRDDLPPLEQTCREELARALAGEAPKN
jgi:hypothetical protein